MFDWGTYLLALAVISAMAVATWLVSVFKRDVSIVDSLWSLLILAAGIVYLMATPEASVRGWVAIALAALWAVRLYVYITARNWGEPEDRRYRAIRANNQPGFAMKSVYIVFLLQAVLASIVSLPLLAAALGSASLSIVDALGAALVLFGIVFEAVADWQLSRFKAQPGAHGRVLRDGLWRYSRHPNYFGECCVWWGFGLIAIAAGAWWGLASPILMTILLLRVSGVALLERDIRERRPEYAEYVERTNAFLPGRPRS